MSRPTGSCDLQMQGIFQMKTDSNGSPLLHVTCRCPSLLDSVEGQVAFASIKFKAIQSPKIKLINTKKKKGAHIPNAIGQGNCFYLRLRVIIDMI